MGRARPPVAEPQSPGPGVFMVEVYRASTDDPVGPAMSVAGGCVLGTIDIPGDELTFYLVAAVDASSAERVVRAGGLRPIRAVAVRYQFDEGRAGGSGKPPMLRARHSRTVSTAAPSERPDGRPSATTTKGTPT